MGTSRALTAVVPTIVEYYNYSESSFSGSYLRLQEKERNGIQRGVRDPRFHHFGLVAKVGAMAGASLIIRLRGFLESLTNAN
jgi:hypothetical protein